MMKLFTKGIMIHEKTGYVEEPDRDPQELLPYKVNELIN